MHLRLSLVFVVAAGLTIAAARSSAERPAPDGSLALAIAAGDTDLFIDEWVSTAPSHAPVLPRIRAIGPEKNVYFAFIVSGHGHDATGRSKVEVDWVMRRPDGRVDTEQQAFSALRGRQCIGNGFAMADPALVYAFAESDPAGVWRLEATARDRVRGRSVTATYAITVVN